MTAQVFIRVAQAKDALRLPVSALGRAVGANQYEVTVINNENRKLAPSKWGLMIAISSKYLRALARANKLLFNQIMWRVNDGDDTKCIFYPSSD